MFNIGYFRYLANKTYRRALAVGFYESGSFSRPGAIKAAAIFAIKGQRYF